LSSPRWLSLLVAEIFYPNTNSEEFQSSTAPPLQDFQKYQEYLQKRAGLASNDSASFYDQKKAQKKSSQICDGYDEVRELFFNN
jgi:DnaJ-domain-containing protein 1